MNVFVAAKSRVHISLTSGVTEDDQHLKYALVGDNITVSCITGSENIEKCLIINKFKKIKKDSHCLRLRFTTRVRFCLTR